MDTFVEQTRQDFVPIGKWKHHGLPRTYSRQMTVDLVSFVISRVNNYLILVSEYSVRNWRRTRTELKRRRQDRHRHKIMKKLEISFQTSSFGVLQISIR